MTRYIPKVGARLSEREKECLDLVILGLTAKEAAQQMGCSHRTVQVYRENLLIKMGARNVAELVRIALTEGSNV